MKKITLLLSFALIVSFTHAQNGLDSISVEIYYVSDAADATGSVGTLPVGSVTYRLWAYMQPGYKLQAIYGIDNIPIGPSSGDHQLRISTTTAFFNNEDYGSTQPSSISTNNLRKNSVMIDSWFSMGWNGAGKVSVPKPADTDGALVNNTTPTPILQNNDPYAGIPIDTLDGMIAGTTPTITVVGIGTSGPNDLYVFDNLSQVGNTFETSNGSIAVLGGVLGPDTANNRVLIGQFTTDGVFCYKLHIQIGTPIGGTQNFVADSVNGSELVIPSLMGCLQYPTGIEHQNPSSLGTFSVYPNPVNGFVTLEFSPASGQMNSNAAYDVYDLQGKNILHKNLGKVSNRISERVDLTSLADGMYVIAVSVGGNISYRKLIKN